MSRKKESGCGWGSIPISVIIAALGGGYWWFIHLGNFNISKFLPNNQQITAPTLLHAPIVNDIVTTPLPKAPIVSNNTPTSTPQALPQTAWDKKVIRGIYLSRYQITNNADEQTIRQRVRNYRAQGINTIIHGVWGNGCTMYNSEVIQQILGYKSCPNQFQEQWLDWLIDEAHKQGMQVHAYFEKGIKIDKNSPIFDLPISKKWIVPGVDRTYAGIDHYVLDVEIPEVCR
ncbi:hypothetical protein RIVM261_087940 [Rivularia sp. IAM M-261]|nr:hypothetical protein RIVM261_087940 [Rivularia sp. IAM M-261]